MSSLDKYNEALCAMDPDEQISRAEKIKSPHTLRRVLSENSPMNLVARFANRVNEVYYPETTHPFSQYESGRIAAAQQEYYKAYELFWEAVAANDPRGYKGLGLAHFYTESDGEIYTIEYLHLALDHGVDDYEINLALGLAYENLRRNKPADKEVVVPSRPIPPLEQNIYVKKALEQSPDPEFTKRFINGFAGLLAKDDEGIADMEYCAEQGSAEAVNLILLYCENMDNPDIKIKLLELKAKNGSVHSYAQIGLLYEQIGDFRAAATAYIRSIKAGYKAPQARLAQLLARLQEDETLCGWKTTESYRENLQTPSNRTIN